MAKLGKVVDEVHKITIDTRVKGKCKTPGHYDMLIICSCGWRNWLSHGEGDTGILAHRLENIEKKIGIRTTIQYVPVREKESTNG